jgi:uncharacterized membrane protein YjfL (UPF0719 family)
MKTRYIFGIVLSITMSFGSYLYMEMCRRARANYFINIMSSSSDSSEVYHESILITEQAALLSLIFLLFFIIMYVLTVKQIKTKKVKNISIVGLAASAILIAWTILMLGSPSHISFDEVGYAWIAYGGLMAILFFAISKALDTEISSSISNDEIVDDII